jgi:hypothetical protein
MPYCHCPHCNTTFHVNVSDPESWQRERFPEYEVNALFPQSCRNCWQQSLARWYPFDAGKSIGATGSEGGSIIKDDEHPDGARITLESNAVAPFAITLGVYGWMFHTTFYSDETTALNTFEAMKDCLGTILALIPLATEYNDEHEEKVNTAISNFIERFP